MVPFPRMDVLNDAGNNRQKERKKSTMKKLISLLLALTLALSLTSAALAGEAPDRIRLIDGSGHEDEVAARVLAALP